MKKLGLGSSVGELYFLLSSENAISIVICQLWFGDSGWRGDMKKLRLGLSVGELYYLLSSENTISIFFFQ